MKWWLWPPPVFFVPPDTAERVQLRQQAQAHLHRGGHSQHLPCSEARKPQSLRCFPLLPERASKGSARYRPSMPLPLEATADKLLPATRSSLHMRGFSSSIRGYLLCMRRWICIFSGFLKEGCELINEALNLFNNVYGAMHVEICACLRLLARLNYIMGDYSEVSKGLRQGLFVLLFLPHACLLKCTTSMWLVFGSSLLFRP